MYNGAQSDFRITVSDDGTTTTITDINVADGDEGTDTLLGVDNLVFASPGRSTWSLSPPNPTISEDGGSLTFTLSRSNPNIAETVFVSTVQDQGFTNNGDYMGLLNQREDFAVGDA